MYYNPVYRYYNCSLQDDNFAENVTKCMIFTEMYARHVNVLWCQGFFRIYPVSAC